MWLVSLGSLLSLPREPSLLPDKRFADPRISIAKQNGCIISSPTFPTHAAPSSEFLALHDPFPDIVDAALPKVSMP